MKPHPEIFRTALERMGVDPAAAVMVGDSLHHDVQGARRAGMRAVWLVRGRASSAAGNAGPIDQEMADVPMIATLRDLPALLTL